MKTKVLCTLFGISLGFLFAFTGIYLVNEEITPEMVTDASTLLGLNFTPAEKDSMIEGLTENREDYQTLRSLKLDNSVPPALVFNPIPPGKTFNRQQQEINWNIPENMDMPENRSDLAFFNLRELASLIKNEKITSVELTTFFLDRLKQYGDTLQAVVSLTEETALEQAQKMDQELANGNYRGPLHGIPYTLKDLFATKGYKTTWGAVPFKDQVIEQDATVYKKLTDAGAVLVAKTTLGALAYGDVWYGGKTRSPWNLERGSSGSSAGPAAVTAAGLVPFSIGTETLGSIVSPSTRTGTTGLRPTYGRVSRHGAMALSWSMDKVGPITRSVEDAAVVFNAIHGPDGQDQSLVNLPFNYDHTTDLSDIKIGYVKSAFEQDYYNRTRDSLTLAKLRELGAELIPIELPSYNTGAMRIILNAEGAAAFNDLTISDADDQMVRQGESAWPNIFRTSRFIPAVEYIEANRARSVLIQKMDSVMQEVDVYVSPAFVGGNLLITNLTGHPSVVLPNGFNDNGEPVSITFTGGLYKEGPLLEVAEKYQQATDFHKRHPKMFME